ncbi:MAG: YceD family protein [Bryobacteraceae bacterium]
MFFSIQELEHRKVLFETSFPPGEIDFLDSHLSQLSDLETLGSVELLGNTLGEIRVQGKLKVIMEAECDRCLEAARLPVESAFDLFYRPATPVKRPHAAEEVKIDEGEAEIAFYEDGLELEDILREQILLSIPMQRICSETCQGICLVCGQNRNLVNCGCQAKPEDDRWAALKNLNVRGI